MISLWPRARPPVVDVPLFGIRSFGSTPEASAVAESVGPMIVKELVLEPDEQNAWIARLIGKGDETPPTEEPEAAPPA